MPREVALALRGPGHRAPFTPDPPDAALTEADPDAVAHGMRRAAALLVERVSALLDHLDANPVRTLHRSAARADAARRLDAAIGCPAGEAQLIAEVAAEAGLLSPAGGAGARRAWRAAGDPVRLRLLLAAWWRMERSPLSGHGHAAGETVARVRRAIFAVLAGVPAGRRFASLPELVQAVGWRAPLLDRELVEGRGPHQLGGVLRGGPRGRALVPGGERGERAAQLGQRTAGDEAEHAGLGEDRRGEPGGPGGRVLRRTAGPVGGRSTRPAAGRPGRRPGIRRVTRASSRPAWWAPPPPATAGAPGR